MRVRECKNVIRHGWKSKKQNENPLMIRVAKESRTPKFNRLLNRKLGGVGSGEANSEKHTMTANSFQEKKKRK